MAKMIKSVMAVLLLGVMLISGGFAAEISVNLMPNNQLNASNFWPEVSQYPLYYAGFIQIWKGDAVLVADYGINSLTVNEGENIAPIVFNDSLIWDNATYEANLGVLCDESFYCVNSFDSVADWNLSATDRSERLNGYVYLSNGLDASNPDFRNTVFDFYKAPDGGVFNALDNITISRGLWGEFHYYKNIDKGVGQFLIKKTRDYAGTPAINLISGQIRNETDGQRYLRFATDNPEGKRAYWSGDYRVYVFPLSLFLEGHNYMFSNGENSQSPIDGIFYYTSSNRAGEKSSDYGQPFTLDIAENSTCDLTYFYPELGNCVRFHYSDSAGTLTKSGVAMSGLFTALNPSLPNFLIALGIAITIIGLFFVISLVIKKALGER